MSHSVFTIVTTIRPGCLNKLKDVLDEIRSRPAQNPYLRFPAFGVLHFASFVIFPDSTLVFENVVDGKLDRYLDQLIKRAPDLDAIFEQCEDYPGRAAPDEAKRNYFERRVSRPQLFHVGTPYRTAASIKADRDVRARLDQALDSWNAEGALSSHLGMDAQGTGQYWRWELVKPWLACAIGGLVAWLVPWLVARTHWANHSWWAKGLISLFDVILLTVGILLAARLWVTALSDLRDRVKHWIPWVIGALILWIAAGNALRSGHRWAISLTVFFVGCLYFTVWGAVNGRKSERLAMIRSGSDGRPMPSLWKRLQTENGSYKRERPPMLARLWNWKWWLVAYLIVFIPIFYLSPRPWVVALLVTVLFLLKAVWLNVLVGWPAKGRWWGWSDQAVAFIAGATLAGFTLVRALQWVQAPAGLLALLVLLALFVLWALPLPSPDISLNPLEREKLVAVVNQEDNDVQNHMAALVLLKTGRFRYRAIFLKIFLSILNHVFYRAWLPDGEKGKLFAIPTVHFAQWVMLDDRRFLFLSNYDHSWTAYLDDFGEKLYTGLQKIWGQGATNPGTSDLGKFKDYVRTTMVPYSVWYSAYPGLTVRQIWNNENIRAGIVRDAGEEEMIKTLRRLGAAPKIVPDIVHARVN